MRRARQTAAGIHRRRYVEWRALREIETGICDGMTYAQVCLILVVKKRRSHDVTMRVLVGGGGGEAGDD